MFSLEFVAPRQPFPRECDRADALLGVAGAHTGHGRRRVRLHEVPRPGRPIRVLPGRPLPHSSLERTQAGGVRDLPAKIPAQFPVLADSGGR